MLFSAVLKTCFLTESLHPYELASFLSPTLTPILLLRCAAPLDLFTDRAMETIVAIVNAQGVLNDVVDSNIEILTEEGFLIADKRKAQLTPEQVAKLNVPDSEAKLYYMGPVVLLLLKREKAFDTMRQIFPQLDDLYYTHTQFLALRDQQLLFPPTPLLERVVVVVKPGYAPDTLTTVLDALVENNFVVLGKAARVLPLDLAQSLVGAVTPAAAAAAAEAAAADPDAAPSAAAAPLDPAEAAIRSAEADLLASEVSISLVLEKLNAVADLKLLLGPQDPEEARVHAPYTLRARLGTSLLNNICYNSDSADRAQSDAAALFPAPFPLERTVALIKPDGAPHAHHMLDAIRAHGFQVQAQDTVYLSQTRCEVLYAHLKGQPYYADLLSYMSSGPSIAVLLSKPAAIASLRALVGPSDPATGQKFAPRSLRARFGADSLRNAVDASADAAAAAADIAAFFPHLAAERVPTADEVEVILTARAGPVRPGAEVPKSLKDVLGEGLAALCKVKPVGDDAIMWLVNWLLRNNPNKPQMTVTHAPADDDDDDDDGGDNEDGITVSGSSAVTVQPALLPRAATGRAGAVAVSGAGTKAAAAAAGSSRLPQAAATSQGVVVTVRPQKSHTDVVGVTASASASSSGAGGAADAGMVVVDPWAAAPVVSVKASAKKPKILWSIGGPGSGQDLLVEALGHSLSLDVIHVPTLLAAAVDQHTECGRVLKRHRELGRPAPSHIVVTLIQQAILQSQSVVPNNNTANGGKTGAATVRVSRAVLLAQFPLSLDDAFAFEQALDAPAAVLSFACSDDAALTRLVATQSSQVRLLAKGEMSHDSPFNIT